MTLIITLNNSYKYIINFLAKISNIIIEFLIYSKYFLYFNIFIFTAFTNIIYYKLFKILSPCLIKSLYFTINLNGYVIIKLVQWLYTNYDLLSKNNIIIKVFDDFYENCYIHNLKYTKKIFKNDFILEFDNIVTLDNSYNIKSGSIAQVYKGKFKNYNLNTENCNLYNYEIFKENENIDIAIKIIHPELKYQGFFPILLLNIYVYLTKNISYFKKYDTIFDLETFIQNLKIQKNMNNEFNNLSYFYEKYLDNNKIIIPKPIIKSDNFIFMTFIEGKKIEELECSFYKKQIIYTIFNLFLKNTFHFLDYFHCDLHSSNWKIYYNKENFDDFKIIIYDFGYIAKNSNKNALIELMNKIDNLDLINTGDVFHSVLLSKEYINKENFIKEFKQVNRNANLLPYDMNAIQNIVIFLYNNNYKVESFCLEFLLTLNNCKNNYEKYVQKSNTKNDNNISDGTFMISTNIHIINICKKYNCFNDYINYLETKLLKNNNLIIDYNNNYKNNNFEKINKENSIMTNVNI